MYYAVGAIPTPFSYYGGTENVPFVLKGPECTGDESSLSQCIASQAFGEVNKYRGEPDDEINMAGVRCEGIKQHN